MDIKKRALVGAGAVVTLSALALVIILQRSTSATSETKTPNIDSKAPAGGKTALHTADPERGQTSLKQGTTTQPPITNPAVASLADVDAEEDRLTTLLHSQGPAMQDETDRVARDIANKMTLFISSKFGQQAVIDNVDCTRCGCKARIRTTGALHATASQLQDVMTGMPAGDPVNAWTGPRVTIPPREFDDQVLLTVFLIRNDSPVEKWLL